VTSLFEFPLPDIGEGVAEGEIVEWKVREGDQVKEDQVLLEVMTDKATVEISSPVRGTVKELLVQAGETAPVGAVLCRIEPAAGAHVPTIAAHGGGHAPAPAKKAEQSAPKEQAPAKAAPAPAAAKAEPSQAKAAAGAAKPLPSGTGPRSAKASELPETPQPPETAEEEETAGEPEPAPDAAPKKPARPEGRRALATPFTRKLAREAGLDIEQVDGTGDGGRVTEQDVRSAAEAAKAPKPAARPATKPAPRERAPSLSEQIAAPAPSGGETRIPIRGLRKRISERMHQSKSTAAHFTYVDDCDVTELVALRGKMKERAAKRGVKLTYMPFIAKALVSAFQQFPGLNGVTDDAAAEFVIKHYYNFGIAVDTEQGLIVPVVKDVDKRSLLDLAQEMDRVATEARDGKSKLEDLKDGTFTITNAGNIGGLFATPIINYPEAAILGVHAIKKAPRVVNDEIQIRDVMYLSISIDHRMNDGATGARFMNHVVSMLQDPQQLLLEM
jgi:pyruvate dehydrogenase E2 component (dihydrolipoamide acetyltransferase)